MAERGVFYLKIVEGKDSGETVQLQGDVISLGGGVKFEVAEDRVVFNDIAMAGTHAMLIWQPRDNTYLISNRSVMNPITVNGQPSGHALLVPGMRLGICNVTLEVAAENYSGPTESCAAPAAIKAEQNMYLGVMPEETVKQERTPTWLLNGAQAPDVGKMSDSWNLIAEAAEKEQASSKSNVLASQVAHLPAQVEAEVKAVTAEPGSAPAQEEEKVVEPLQEMEPAGPAPLGTLVVVKGQNTGMSMDVFDIVTIGRHPECDFVLTDNAVSRQHCTIYFNGGIPYIRNTSSSNSLKLGKTKIKKEAPLPSPVDIMLANEVQIRWTATEK